MRPVVLYAGPYSAASSNGLVTSVTPTTGTLLTLVTNTVDTTPRRIIVTPASQTNAGTLTVTGTTWGGQTATEVMTVPPSSTAVVTSALDYLTIAAILPGGGPWSAAITVGTQNSTLVGSSAWFRWDDFANAVGNIAVNVSGTFSYSVQHSNDDPDLVLPRTAVAPYLMTWFNDPNFTSLTTSAMNAITARPLWSKLTCLSYSSTGNGSATISQSGGKLGG